MKQCANCYGVGQTDCHFDQCRLARCAVCEDCLRLGILPMSCDEILHVAWARASVAPRYEVGPWEALAKKLAGRMRGGQDADIVYECLGGAGKLLAAQGGQRGSLEKLLEEALAQARLLRDTTWPEDEVTWRSGQNCLAWVEVEHLRRVLGLPEGGG